APVRHLISVDLPAPFSPRSAWISPARRSKSTPSSARVPGNTLVSDRTVSSVTPDPSPLAQPRGRAAAAPGSSISVTQILAGFIFPGRIVRLCVKLRLGLDELGRFGAFGPESLKRIERGTGHV